MRCPTLAELPPPPPNKSGWPWTEESPQLLETMPDARPWPRISIVTPSYNQGRFIEETIRSVLLQGYPNLEYIIFDAGSKDESVEIIRKYEPWLSYWLSEPDKGQSDAINKGWQRATGELVTWLNSDDVYMPAAFQRVAQSWRNENDVGFIYGQAQCIDMESRLISLSRVIGGPFDLRRSLENADNYVAVSAFISRIAIEKIGYLDINLHMSMDWDMWLRLGSHFESIFVPEVLIKYRWWSNSKTASQWGRPEEVKVVRKFFHENNLPLFGQAVRRKALAAAYGEVAKKYYVAKDAYRFRKSMLLSLLYNPGLKGGAVKSRLPEFFLGSLLWKFVKSWKRRVLNGKKTIAGPSAKS